MTNGSDDGADDRSVSPRHLDPGEAHYADPTYRCKRCGSAALCPHGMGSEVFRHVCESCGCDSSVWRAFDDSVRRDHHITSEDWCRGLYSSHPEPRSAFLAVRTTGIVTIIYLPDPVTECHDPVCNSCYQAWLERQP